MAFGGGIGLHPATAISHRGVRPGGAIFLFSYFHPMMDSHRLRVIPLITGFTDPLGLSEPFV